MTDTALLALLLAALAGLAAGRAWASANRRELRERAAFRASPHYSQGLHYLAAGQLDLAISELGKVVRDDPDAVEVFQVLGSLLREAGQVERAIQVHQRLLARADVTRGERANALAALGADFRTAGFLDRAAASFLNDYFAAPDKDPRLLAQRVTREVEVTAVLPIPNSESWKLQWIERERSHAGGVTETTPWEAYVTVRLAPPDDAERIQANPLGLYVTGINWTAIHVPENAEGGTP